LDAELSDSAINAIQVEYEKLGHGAVSVRSSATAEDLPDASFAGQYDSFLNVLSLDQITERLLRVWASLYSPHAIAYRLRHGIEHGNVRMAVIVQRQLQADAAGVLFTRDPLTGSNHFVINAALGLGEGVVSGTAPSDRYIVEPKTGGVLSSDIVLKEFMVAATTTGGVSAVPVPEMRQKLPALDQHQLSDLTAFGRQLVDLLGSPQDIEFAVADGDLHLLQARPATAVDTLVEPDEDWETSVDTRYGWLLHPVLSRSPMYRLQEDAVAEYVKSQRTCFEETGASLSTLHITQTIHVFVYARSPEIEDEALAERHARHAARWDACVERGTSYYEAEVRAKVEAALARLSRLHSAASGLRSLVAYLEAATREYGYVMGHLHWCQQRPGPRFDWQATYNEITGEPPANANVFVMAISNRTTRLIGRLRELARIVQSDSDLAAAFRERRFELLDEPDLKQHVAVKAFLSGFKRMLGVYGLRTGRGFGSSAEFDTPTWNMDPGLPLDLIASYAEQDLDRVDRLQKQARRERESAIRRVRRQLAHDPERLGRFEYGLNMATNQVRFMEDHNFLMEQCTHGTLREAIFEIGSVLLAEGIIDGPDDALHISLEELKEIAEIDEPRDLRPVVRERSALRERRARMRPPQTLGNGPIPTNPTQVGAALPPGVGMDGSVIRGVGASGGKVAGIARLALSGGERPKIRPGDILVAPNAGPEWTPAYGLLGGLVLDQGALFQHAALVAREYRIPAVIQTRDATTYVREGQLIVVDGDNGIIELDV
jgi:pyruvate,water dikinase